MLEAKIFCSISANYCAKMHFIIFKAGGRLWFGRDIFGRRSLLWNFKQSTFQLCSLAVDIQERKVIILISRFKITAKSMSI